MISLPFVVLLSTMEMGCLEGGVDVAYNALGGVALILVMSLVTQWLGMLVLIRRGHNRLRQMPRTRLGPPMVIDSYRLLRFRETLI